VPYTQVGLPFRGRTQLTKHASWRGARAAERARITKTRMYLELVRTRGPLTDHEASEILQFPLATVNSIRHGVQHKLRPIDQVDGVAGAKRTRWGLRAADVEAVSR
jgi:hypothetical protein